MLLTEYILNIFSGIIYSIILLSIIFAHLWCILVILSTLKKTFREKKIKLSNLTIVFMCTFTIGLDLVSFIKLSGLITKKICRHSILSDALCNILLGFTTLLLYNDIQAISQASFTWSLKKLIPSFIVMMLWIPFSYLYNPRYLNKCPRESNLAEGCKECGFWFSKFFLETTYDLTSLYYLSVIKSFTHHFDSQNMRTWNFNSIVFGNFYLNMRKKYFL